MFKNPMIWIVSLVTVLAACGDGTSNGTVDNDDASTTNPETAVREDAPVSQPDVPVVTVDAGTATDVVSPEDVPTIVEDRPSVPADDGVVMAMPFSNETCTRVNELCWGFQGEATCLRVVCYMDGLRAFMNVPENLLEGMGPEANCLGTPSGGACEGQNRNGTPTGGRWFNLTPTMDSFTFARPGYPNRTVEGHSR